MGCYHGNRAQANFAQFFMLNARILESLKLEVAHRNYNDEILLSNMGCFVWRRRLLEVLGFVLQKLVGMMYQVSCMSVT